MVDVYLFKTHLDQFSLKEHFTT